MNRGLKTPLSAPSRRQPPLPIPGPRGAGGLGLSAPRHTFPGHKRQARHSWMAPSTGELTVTGGLLRARDFTRFVSRRPNHTAEERLHRDSAEGEARSFAPSGVRPAEAAAAEGGCPPSTGRPGHWRACAFSAGLAPPGEAASSGLSYNGNNLPSREY